LKSALNQRRFGIIRESMVTSASDADGWQLRHIVSTENTSSEVWADTAYRLELDGHSMCRSSDPTEKVGEGLRA